MKNYSLDAATKVMGGQEAIANPTPFGSSPAAPTDLSGGINDLLYGGAVPLDAAMSDVPKPTGVSGFTNAFLGRGASIARKEAEVKQLMSAAQRGISPEEFYTQQRQEMQTAQVNQEDLMLGVVAGLLSDNRFKAKLAASPYMAAIQNANQANQFALKDNQTLAGVVNNSADNQNAWDTSVLNDQRIREMADQADTTKREVANADAYGNLAKLANDELGSFADDLRMYLEKSTGWTQNDENHVNQWVTDYVARFGRDPQAIKARVMQPAIGQVSANTMDKNSDNARMDAKFDFDVNRFNQEFKLKTDTIKQKDAQFKTTHAEKVREFDLKFEQAVKQFEATNGRQLSRDEWQKAYQKGMMSISQQNADTSVFNAETNRMKATGTASKASGLAPGNVSAAGVTKWKNEFKKQFAEAAPEQFGPGSVATSTHPSGKGLDLRFKDNSKNNPQSLETFFNYAKSQQVPYIIFNKKQYKLQPNGQYTASNYNGPHAHEDHVHIDWHTWDGKGAKPQSSQGKPSGMGIPYKDSYAAKGDKAPAYQPNASKPAESKPDAKKGQNTTKSGFNYDLKTKK